MSLGTGSGDGGGARRSARPAGESPGDERTAIFSAFHSGKALAAMGAGRTLAELPSLHPRGKEGFMVPHLPSRKTRDCMATSCPFSDNVSKAENILKTKERKRAFL